MNYSQNLAACAHVQTDLEREVMQEELPVELNVQVFPSVKCHLLYSITSFLSFPYQTGCCLLIFCSCHTYTQSLVGAISELSDEEKDHYCSRQQPF